MVYFVILLLALIPAFTRAAAPLNLPDNLEFADPSVPDFSDPREVKIYSTGGQILAWRRSRGENLREVFRREPRLSVLHLCHSDGTPFDVEAGEDIWDPSVRDGVLYGGAMLPPAKGKPARWPEDSWNRRVFPFVLKNECWTMKSLPLWGERPGKVDWTGHGYGHHFFEENGKLFVFYERVTETKNGRPFKTEIFAREMNNKFRAEGSELPIYKLGRHPYPATHRRWGGFIAEGPRPFRAAGKFLLAFSAGDYDSDRYGIHLLWSEKIAGPYTPYLNSRSTDLKDFGRTLERGKSMTWGAGRAAIFEEGGQLWALFHGIEKTDKIRLERGLRTLYLAEVQVTSAGEAKPPRVDFR